MSNAFCWRVTIITSYTVVGGEDPSHLSAVLVYHKMQLVSEIALPTDDRWLASG